MDEESIEARAEAGDLAAIAEIWYRSGEAKRIKSEAPPEFRQRFEVCRAITEELKSELGEHLAEAQGWDSIYTLGLYTRFATAVACLVAQSKSSEFSSDSVFAPRAEKHAKFVSLWLPMMVKQEILKAVAECGPKELIEYLSNRNHCVSFRNKLDNAIERALKREGLIAAEREAANASPVAADVQPSAPAPLISDPAAAESTHMEAGLATSEGTGQSRKRGPKPITEAEARHLAEIVKRIAPDGDWRAKLDDVGNALAHGVCSAADPENCDASDHEKIPLPRGWRQKKANWLNPPDQASMVKAIQERLKKARGKSTTDTPA